MLVQEELARVNVSGGSAVAVGVFDGVHRGHQFLISRLIENARKRSLSSVAVTFHPHPRLVLRPDETVTYLTSLDERLELLRGLGVDHVAVVTFTSDLANMSAREFVSLLCNELRMRSFFIGSDQAIGRNREGTADVLQALGQEMGYTVEVVPPVIISDPHKVSSTAIRAALAEGNMPAVAEQLGRPFSLRGPVVLGDQRGRLIGFPTANIAIGADRALPAFGVYVTRAYLGETCYKSVTNIGRRPTFQVHGVTVETHILDFDGDIYGRELRIELLKMVRPEMRFSSVDELKQQIQRDIEAVRSELA
jgi:riboflavin kinase/FMN adenylyltransferase